MSLLPSRKNVSSHQQGELKVLGVDEEGTGDVFEALSSDTAREVLTEIYDDPAPSSEIADRLGMSLQSVSYHLENLSDAGIIRVADTQYSEKGKEMKIYAPAEDPVVLFVGTEDRRMGFLDVFKRLVGATGLLLLGSIYLYISGAFGAADSSDDSIIEGVFATPGVEFLLGGLFILLLVTIWWSWTQ